MIKKILYLMIIFISFFSVLACGFESGETETEKKYIYITVESKSSDVTFDIIVPIPGPINIHYFKLEMPPENSSMIFILTQFEFQPPYGPGYMILICDEEKIFGQWYILFTWDGTSLILDIYGNDSFSTLDNPGTIYYNNVPPIIPDYWTFTITNINTNNYNNIDYEITFWNWLSFMDGQAHCLQSLMLV